jgi:hypothetical protein
MKPFEDSDNAQQAAEKCSLERIVKLWSVMTSELSPMKDDCVFEAGEMIPLERAMQTVCYHITKGGVGVFQQRRPLFIVQKGECIGYGQLFNTQGIALRALDTVEASIYKCQDVDEATQKTPSFRASLAEIGAYQIHSLSQMLPETLEPSLTRASGRTKFYSAGSRIIKEGKKSDSVHLLLSGRAVASVSRAPVAN